MPIRKGKLWKQCIKCGEMYEPHTKKAGLCPKCNPKRSFLDLIAETQRHKQTIKHKKTINKHRKVYKELIT